MGQQDRTEAEPIKTTYYCHPHNPLRGLIRYTAELTPKRQKTGQFGFVALRGFVSSSRKESGAWNMPSRLLPLLYALSQPYLPRV